MDQQIGISSFGFGKGELMATHVLFDVAAERLEQKTDLDRLETRGTLRIALKESGLDPKSLTFSQLAVVFDRVMPRQLEALAVEDSAAVCSSVMSDLSDADLASASSKSSSDEIFSRLGGD